MVGLFLNTIPVRVRMEPAATFAGLLQDVQRAAIESMRHDHCALVEVQAESAMKHGLFDHALVFENHPENAPAGGAGFVVTSVEIHEPTNYDFGAIVQPGTQFRILFNYNGCAYSSAQMERLEMHFRTLLAQILRDDRVALDDLGILTPAEKTVAVGPRVPGPSDSTLVGLWEAQVARTPDNNALSLDERSWSYRQVNERANQIAHMLRTRLALRLEDRVGVLMERGEGRVIALLGILKAGGAYCPIGSTCPEERLRFLLEDSGCRAVLGDAEGVQRVNAVLAGVAVDIAECRTEPVHNPPPVCGAANLAYLIYTSGTTGRPKGVLTEHGGFVNMILDQIRSFGITPEDRVLQFASSSFDASLSEIFMALAAGACLVLIREETRRDGSLFQACMRKQRISAITLPPSLPARTRTTRISRSPRADYRRRTGRRRRRSPLCDPSAILQRLRPDRGLRLRIVSRGPSRGYGFSRDPDRPAGGQQQHLAAGPAPPPCSDRCAGRDLHRGQGWREDT